jgi:hypothetical protein
MTALAALLRHWKLAFGLLAIVASFGAGWRVSALRCDARLAKIERAAEGKRARQQATVNRKATDYEREKSNVIDRGPEIRTIYKDRAVPAACEPEPDAVRVLDAARAEANGRASGQSGAAVPAD